jgi:hypothetical protein
VAIFALSFCHLLNDSIQALIPAIYPLLKESFKLNFTQIRIITLTFGRPRHQPVVDWTRTFPNLILWSLHGGNPVRFDLLALAPTIIRGFVGGGWSGFGGLPS